MPQPRHGELHNVKGDCILCCALKRMSQDLYALYHTYQPPERTTQPDPVGDSSAVALAVQLKCLSVLRFSAGFQQMIAHQQLSPLQLILVNASSASFRASQRTAKLSTRPAPRTGSGHVLAASLDAYQYHHYRLVTSHCLVYGSCITTFSISAKFGVPLPVTGSQPFSA